MNEPSYRSIAANGLWNNNTGLVQLLGLCPLLAVTSTVINGLGLGLATTATLVASNTTVSLIRRVVRPEVRIPVFVLVIASIVTVIELSMNAYFHQLYKILGIFIPLIVTNCSIIGRAEAFASKHTPDRAFLDGLMMGLGFTLVLVTLGGMRELVGHGTLLSHAQLMFGPGAKALTVTVIHNYGGFLLAILPPGAFLGLGLLIALKNVIDARRERRAARAAAPAAQPAGTPA
ncbi:MAG TPA: electron transport complex subunit E [Gammaproteobacteria bacterium]|nr:electron transport complex subunit E [Gammaproteobacteria bacterium]